MSLDGNKLPTQLKTVHTKTSHCNFHSNPVSNRGLPNILFSSGLLVRILYIFRIFLTRAVCSIHLFAFDVLTIKLIPV